MKISCDLDGVIYSWDSAARYMLREIRGCPGLEEPSTSWDSIQQKVSPQDWHWLWNEGIERGLFRYGHIEKGAIVGIRALAKAGHKISIVTHRPTQAVRDTIDFLSYAHLPLSGVYILSHAEPKSQVDTDVLIDDKPANIEDWQRTGRRAILFSQPWNRDYDAGDRAVGWKGVIDNVRSL